MRRVRLSQAVRRLPGAGAGARGGRARGRSVVRVRADRGRTGDRGGAPGDLRDGLPAGIALESGCAGTRRAHPVVRPGRGDAAGGRLGAAAGAERDHPRAARPSPRRHADRLFQEAALLRGRRLMADGALLLLQAAADSTRAYGDFPVIGARAFVWITAEVHLMFAAFVLGVAMFAPSMWVYAALFFVESFTLYLYYYGWDRWKKGRAKLGHWTLGILLNVWGTVVMFIANSWLTYMMSPPRDITPTTDPTTIKLWHAIANATWMPINVHRVIANVVFGGAIVGAYASYRFLAARTDEERAHYDWMGYVGNFIAMSALIVLPFAGYWLGREIYQYDQSMGITMMGGFMSWLWVIQAFLIAVLFLTGNYYLWIGMGRIPGAERFRPYTKYLLIVLVLGAIVWGTPHTMIADSKELAAMGGSHHPFLGAVGAHGDHHPGSDVRRRGRGRAVLRHPRLLRRSDRAHRVQRLSGPGGALVHRVRHGDRHPHGTRRPIAGRDPLGE